MTTQDVKIKIEHQINISNKAIERHIDDIDFSDRGCVSQDILQDLRTFIQTIMLRLYAEDHNITYDFGSEYDKIGDATKAIKGKIHFLGKFYDYIQTVASHYTLEPESSERVMLKYMEYLIKTKKLVADRLNISLLNNLEKFPVNIDKNLKKYYKEIANSIVQNKNFNDEGSSDRYYIHKIKPFFINLKTYYEITFTPTNNQYNKSDRMIAFTELDISEYYATKLWIVSDHISILNRQLPILIIKKWEVSIRPIEIENLGTILGMNLRSAANSSEGRGLMQYLQDTDTNLVDLVSSSKSYYNNAQKIILNKYNAKTRNIFNSLDRCRNIILNNNQGANVLKYLLLHLNNKIMKLQIDTRHNGNEFLSNLFLKNGCIPFDQMPFDSSLIGHNPKLGDLFECIDSKERKHELLARFIRQNTEKNNILYTPENNLNDFANFKQLIREFNSNLYESHKPDRELRMFKRHIYIYKDQESIINTLTGIKKLTKSGVVNYTNFVNDWLDSPLVTVDDDSKRNALKNIFKNSHIALIYGAAGTGKTTLINHISSLFKDTSRLYLAQTNPAVDNMKRRVVNINSETTFSTITKFLKKKNNRTSYDILFIDECSTISNADIENILNKSDIKMAVLVGDTYQIESIRFGNWFSLAKQFFPNSVVDLSTSFRSSNKDLTKFWDKVRLNANDIQEVDARCNYSEDLNQTIFEKSDLDKDEIVLCLNYDGLYGINNINSLLQENNPNKAVKCGLKSYKVNDPILFNDSEYFGPSIYNNLKGWIRKIKENGNKVQFDIEIDKSLTELDSVDSCFELVSNERISNSIIRFSIDTSKLLSTDDNLNDESVPFQIAYAVSIHKSQGLEYNSVKIVITDEVEEQITHSIFYTAITRAKKILKIYWSPEVEQKIIKQLQPRENKQDYYLLKNIFPENTEE